MSISSWLAENATNLAGHIVTILVFIGGFVLMRRQTTLDVTKDRAVKYFEHRTNAIERNTALIETIRLELYLLSIQPFRRDARLNRDTERRLVSISKLRAEWFSTSLFVPAELKDVLIRANGTFDSFTKAISSGDSSTIEQANHLAHQAVNEWRIAAEQWADNQGKELGIWQ